jgi:hypothetical protein
MHKPMPQTQQEKQFQTFHYRVPDPLRSEEEAVRFEHLDLPDLDSLALWRERRRAEIALAFISDAQQSACLWLVERLAALAKEELRRKVFDR